VTSVRLDEAFLVVLSMPLGSRTVEFGDANGGDAPARSLSAPEICAEISWKETT